MSEIEGRDAYERARAMGRGVIVVTAHLGSFEVALAALAEVEPRLYVVFRRDEMKLFERARSTFRRRLGVRECPIDDGLTTWVKLRGALRDGATVLIQGDRIFPDQPGTPVRFGEGRILVSHGPAKLARLTSSPLVPAVSIREPNGSIRILIGDPIEPPSDAGDDAPTMQRVAEALGAFVSRYPDQWITIAPVFLDEPRIVHPMESLRK